MNIIVLNVASIFPEMRGNAIGAGFLADQRSRNRIRAAAYSARSYDTPVSRSEAAQSCRATSGSLASSMALTTFG